MERATSCAPGPAKVTAGNASSCTTIGMPGTVLTAATVRRRLTAHTGSRSSGLPGSSTSTGVHSAPLPVPNRTVNASGDAAVRSQTRSTGVAATRSAGAGCNPVACARCCAAFARAFRVNASRWRRYTRRVSLISPCRSCGLIMPNSPKSIISGKINIIGLTVRPDVIISAITAPTATTITIGSKILITGCVCGFCAVGTGSARSCPVGSAGTSGVPAVGASTASWSNPSIRGSPLFTPCGHSSPELCWA